MIYRATSFSRTVNIVRFKTVKFRRVGLLSAGVLGSFNFFNSSANYSSNYYRMSEPKKHKKINDKHEEGPKSIQIENGDRPIELGDTDSGFCLNDYDAVGFDLDNTLCKYKLPATYRFSLEFVTKYLIEKGYPKEIAVQYDTAKDFMQKGLILDKYRGNILKLGEDYSILRASHGTQALTKQEIESIYGSNFIWEPVKSLLPKLLSNYQENNGYYVFKDYFTACLLPLCGKIVDIIDKQMGKPKNGYNFWPDIYNGIVYMFNMQSTKGSHSYFGMLKKDPGRYIERCSDNIKEWLHKLKKEKVVFLLTSSGIEAASMLASHCLGTEWMKYFDIVITYARKPGFFMLNRPFKEIVDQRERDSALDASILRQNASHNYSQGNWNDLLSLLSHIQKKDAKVVYFGDSLIEDCCACPCDSVSIVEEIEGEQSDSPSSEVSSKQWGSFCEDISLVTGNPIKTFWCDVISCHSKLSIPGLEYLSCLPLGHKFESFNENNKMGGFFPNYTIGKLLNSKEK